MIDFLLSIKGQKQIVKEIIENFKKENNVDDLKYYAVTTSRYLLDNITLRKYSFDKNPLDAYYYSQDNSGAFYPSSRMIVIFIRGKKIIIPHVFTVTNGIDVSGYTSRIKDYDNAVDNKYYYNSDKYISIVQFIETIFHELRHVEQRLYGNQYTLFIKKIEELIKDFEKFHYDNNHDDYYSEIDADISAIENLKLYIKNYPEIENETTSYVKQQEKDVKARYDKYDIDDFITKFYNIIQRRKEKAISKANDTEWFKLFFTSQGEFKNIEYILALLKLDCKVDSKIILELLSSTAYITHIDYDELDEETSIAVSKLINYRIKQHKKKYELTNNKEYIKKINELKIYLQKLKVDNEIKSL